MTFTCGLRWYEASKPKHEVGGKLNRGEEERHDHTRKHTDDGADKEPALEVRSRVAIELRLELVTAPATTPPDRGAGNVEWAQLTHEAAKLA